MGAWYNGIITVSNPAAAGRFPQPFMNYVYILKSLKDNKLYIGYTSNLRLRYKEHSNGEVKSTRNRLPMKLVYYEAYKSEKDARAREKYLKNGGKAHNTLKDQIKNSIV